MTVENAKIEEAYLGGWDSSVPRVGSLVVGLSFSGDGWGQGSGHFGDSIEEFVTKVLETVEVSSWDRLKGTYCRVRRENGRLVAVGHLLKDKWFVFASLYKKGT